MERETEEAIQNVGNFCKNLGEGSAGLLKAVLVIELIVLGVFVLFGFVVPWFQCEFWEEEWCNAMPAVVEESHPREAVFCDLNVEEHGEWVHESRVFDYGWQEVKTYMELFPNTKVIQCEGRFTN